MGHLARFCLRNMDDFYSNFANDEIVNIEPQLAERDTRNSEKSNCWINVIIREVRQDRPLTYIIGYVNQTEVVIILQSNLRILCMSTYPALPKDLFFTAFKLFLNGILNFSSNQSKIYCRYLFVI